MPKSRVRAVGMSSRPDAPPAPCGLVSAVRPGSPADLAGIRIGDCLLAIDGHPLRDVLDVLYYGAEPSFEVGLVRAGRMISLPVTRSYDEEDLGVDFRDLLFDGMRLCGNRCDFCFVAQMPRGVRRSLLVRDDDYRLSFLHGNFVTLTNLEESDWDRMAAQRISPLYVSVHATDRAVRDAMLGISGGPDILEQLGRLHQARIEVHTQVVLTPGVNDAAVLEHTLRDLRALYPRVLSVSLIPVGLTKYHRRCVHPLTQGDAQSVVRLARTWQTAMRSEWGIEWVYPSDELLLLARGRIPSAARYDGFPQLENGVGLVRWFLEDWRRARRRLARLPRLSGLKATAITGTAFAPFLGQALAALVGTLDCRVQTVAVRNDWLGESVTVAGLLSGEDVIRRLKGRDLGDLLLLPRAMLDRAGERTLEDMTSHQMEERLEVRVAFVDSMSGVIEALVDRARLLC